VNALQEISDPRSGSAGIREMTDLDSIDLSQLRVSLPRSHPVANYAHGPREKTQIFMSVPLPPHLFYISINQVLFTGSYLANYSIDKFLSRQYLTHHGPLKGSCSITCWLLVWPLVCFFFGVLVKSSFLY